jgi:hypothetical protein
MALVTQRERAGGGDGAFLHASECYITQHMYMCMSLGHSFFKNGSLCYAALRVFVLWFRHCTRAKLRLPIPSPLAAARQLLPPQSRRYPTSSRSLWGPPRPVVAALPAVLADGAGRRYVPPHSLCIGCAAGRARREGQSGASSRVPGTTCRRRTQWRLLASPPSAVSTQVISL